MVRSIHPARPVGSLSLELYQRWALSAEFDLCFIAMLLVAEFALGFLIIRKVPYTEIDWVAYMQEVEAFVDRGELDYREIRGDTGPLGYPAGFLYLFACLRQITQNGTNVLQAQFLFLGFYVATQGTVLLIYQLVMQAEQQRLYCNSNIEVSPAAKKSSQRGQFSSETLSLSHRIWCWRMLMGLICLSKRLHSIFMLRLFNDGPTMLFLYMSMLFFMKQQWSLGCLVYSCAVSLKMNVLLFALGLLLLLILQARLQVKQAGAGSWWSIAVLVIVRRLLICCALPQLVFGAPFLTTYPVSYLRKAFELDRVFFYKWTVNLKFLPESVFVSKQLSLLLLLLHLFALGLLARQWWLSVSPPDSAAQPTKYNELAPDFIAYTMMVSNFVGIAFARTLHYQFYSWYFHSVPLILWYHPLLGGDGNPGTSFPWRRLLFCIVVMAALEGAFLTFPATPMSSAILQIAHAAVLWHVKPPAVDTIHVVVNSLDDKDSKKTK